MLSRVALAAHASLLLATPLANPALGAPGQGHSVVSVLESRSSDLEVADRLWQMEASGGNWLAMLFDVFKESRRDVQENQKYWLKRLEERNKINDAISEYMKELTEQARKLNEKKAKAAEDEEKDRDQAILQIEAGLQRLEARTRAVEDLPDPLRRELAVQAERERLLLGRARRIVTLKPATPRRDPKKQLRPMPRPVDPPPESPQPAVRDSNRFRQAN